MIRMVSRITLLTLTVTCSVMVAIAAQASPSNKWRLQFSGGANSDGEIVVRITPEGGEPFDTDISIEDGQGENSVAKSVTKRLKSALPKKSYHVERDDGEDVLVKRKHGVPNFVIEIVSNSVEGVRISIDRE